MIDPREPWTPEQIKEVRPVLVFLPEYMRAERYARWCERTGVNHSLLLDFHFLTPAESVFRQGECGMLRSVVKRFLNV